MTKNQIEYLKAVETQRSNRAQEDLTRARDLAQIEVARGTLAETSRHNKKVERETTRSNVARERETNRANIAKELETATHNRAVEEQAKKELAETSRHNIVVESENNRHNVITERQNQQRINEEARSHLAQEAIGRTQASAAVMSAQAQRENAAAQTQHIANETRATNEKYNSSYAGHDIPKLAAGDPSGLSPYQLEVYTNYLDSESKRSEQHARTWELGTQAASNVVSIVGSFLGAAKR